MAQYPNPQPYCGLALPQLGLGVLSHALANQGDPIRAPKQPDVRQKQQYFSVCQSVEYVASIRNGESSIPTHSPTLI